MKASLPNAFAAVRLGSILEFHLSRPGTGGPDRPYSPYVPRPEEPTKSSRRPLPLSHVRSFVGEVRPPRSPRFFPGNLIHPSVRLATGGEMRYHEPRGGAVPRGAAPSRGTRTFNYELFNCSNFNVRYWSWNYRGCWHQTCPPIVPR